MSNKEEHIRVYVSEETKQDIQQIAEKEGLNPSPWMRRIAKKQIQGEQV